MSTKINIEPSIKNMIYGYKSVKTKCFLQNLTKIATKQKQTAKNYSFISTE